MLKNSLFLSSHFGFLKVTPNVRSAAWRGCELRNRLFSTKIIFLAKREREFTTKFAILPNGCYQQYYLKLSLTLNK